ncbi:MAG TPA: J domain-containing protein [Terriglobia bacterium]|nr:J domain-containing protein [Terriglobia bacterium]
MDYYELLQIDASATFDEVHKAYRSLAMRYHPDRNLTPGASSVMSSINQAYAVLSEPSRRRLYDEERSKTQPFDMAGSILSAASDKLLKQGWIVAENGEKHMILEQAMRAVRVTFVRRLDNELLKKIGRQFPGFSVVLAVEIDLPINLSFNTAVVDLVHSRYHGPPFPEEAYRLLFAPFIRP